eukprot:1029434-Rhodomonas_salina.4
MRVEIESRLMKTNSARNPPGSRREPHITLSSLAFVHPGGEIEPEGGRVSWASNAHATTSGLNPARSAT